MSDRSVGGVSGHSTLEALSCLCSIVQSSTSSTAQGLVPLLKEVSDIFDGEGALLWVADDNQQTLAKKGTFHSDTAHSKAFELESSESNLKFGDESLAAHVWANTEPRLMAQPAMFKQTPLPSATNEHGSTEPSPLYSLAFPLMRSGTTFGVIEIVGCSVTSLDHELRSLLKILGSVLGSAINSIETQNRAQSLSQQMRELESNIASLQEDLRDTKDRLARQHEHNVRVSTHANQRLRRISQELRTPLNGIVGMVELLQRIELGSPQQEYVGIIKDSADVLLSILQTIVELANKDISFLPTATESLKAEAGPDAKVGGTAASIAHQASPAANSTNIMTPPNTSGGNSLTQPEKKSADLRVLSVTGLVGSSEFIEPYVTASGIRCSSSGRGHAALTKMRQAIDAKRPFDVIFVEMVLPDMDALEFVRTVRQDASLAHSKLILVSTFGSPVGEDRALRYGFDAHIAKPVKQAQVIATISNVLSQEQKVGNHTHTVVVPTTTPGSHTILVAEDNLVNQKVAMLQLKELGFFAKVVPNGREAVEALETGNYDAVLMDCQMPDMDGFNATRRIREMEEKTGRHMPIIAMTAHALSTDRDRCFAAGMDDYMSKPVTYDKLQSVLSRWVNLRDNISTEGDPTMAESSQTNQDVASFNPNLTGDTAPIDVSQLEEMLGPDETSEILLLFISSTEELLERIDKAVDNKDGRALKEAAHELKGACSSVGAKGMAQSCFDLEQAAKSDDWDNAPRIQSGLNQTFEFTRSWIQNLNS